MTILFSTAVTVKCSSLGQYVYNILYIHFRLDVTMYADTSQDALCANSVRLCDATTFYCPFNSSSSRVT